MILRQLFLPLLSAGAIAAVASEADTLSVDTLFTASKAREIEVVSKNNSTKIVAKNINESSDWFFYEATSTVATSKRSVIKEITATDSTMTLVMRSADRQNFRNEKAISCADISSLVVSQSDSAVCVSFLTAGSSEPQQYTFPFPDPANRVVKSYVGPKGSNLGITLSSSSRGRWEMCVGDFNMGWMVTNDPTLGYAPSWKRSFEVGILSLIGVRYSWRASSLQTGLGIRGLYYKMRDQQFLDLTDDDRFVMLPYAEGQSKHRSTLKLSQLQVPLIYGLKFGKNGVCKMQIGPVATFNVGSELTTSYMEGGKKYTITTKHLPTRLAAVDAYCALSYDGLGIYARYSPMRQFRASSGLDFSTVTFGMTLVF